MSGKHSTRNHNCPIRQMTVSGHSHSHKAAYVFIRTIQIMPLLVVPLLVRTLPSPFHIPSEQL